MAYLGECSMYTREEYVFCFFGWSILYISLGSKWALVLFKSSVPYLLSGSSSHNWKWDIEGSYYSCVCVYFSLQVCQCLLHLFGSSSVRCIYIYYCYISLVNWSFYYYIMSFFVSVTVFVLKSILSMAIPDLFRFLFAWNIFFNPFTFRLHVYLDLKWVNGR